MTIAEFFIIRPHGPNCCIGLGAFRLRVLLETETNRLEHKSVESSFSSYFLASSGKIKDKTSLSDANGSVQRKIHGQKRKKKIARGSPTGIMADACESICDTVYQQLRRH